MKLITWNCRGANNNKFRRNCKEIMTSYKPDMICLLETKASFRLPPRFFARMGFSENFQVPSAGLAGGIWLFWNPNLISIQIINSESQLIHCFLSQESKSLHATFAYVQPHAHKKEEFWQQAVQLSQNIRGPWILMGDFNDIAYETERSPQNRGPMPRSVRFREHVHSCALMDMEASGCKYTWIQRRNGSVILRERLDRVLTNIDFRLLFSEAKSINLPCIHGDHHPILLDTESVPLPKKDNKPKRFVAAWLLHNDFPNIFRDAWAAGSTTEEAIRHVQSACYDWNLLVFGNIFKRKRRLVARISGIQSSPNYGLSSFLQAKERELLTEFQSILQQEELLWFQKSRKEWIASGDRNTSYYHRSALIRRNRNKIGSLRINGEWSSDPEELKSHVRSYYDELFRSRPTSQGSTQTSNCQCTIDDHVHDMLLAPATELEVKNALFQMKGLKSPGPDGISAIFFQKNWDTVCSSLVTFVNSALDTATFNVSLARAYITLIPKGSDSETIQSFRPISLLNVTYKLLSKVLVNRIRPLLEKLIGPHQSSFLPGRSTSDNIILTQEAIHSMRNSKCKKGSMILKIDLHKAFDCVSWDFLREVLSHFNFPPILINLILFCVSSCSLSVLWNGESLPPFSPGRGLRQGDPLSPYLFILVMEKLAYMIQEKVNSGRWKPLKISRGGVTLSHLFFADDLMIFGEATSRQLDLIMNCLDTFANVSGLTMNLHKSKLFTSPGVPNGVANMLSRRCGIPRTSDLGLYLGAPMLHGRVTKDSHRFIVDRMERRLASWKQNSLTMAGRRILVQSVTSSMPIYNMQSILLPASVCGSIDKINRDFLWGSNSEKRKMHHVKWSTICLANNDGGLGLRSARDINLSLVTKLGWRILSHDNAPWCQALRLKYMKDKPLWECSKPQKSSAAWHAILQSRDLLRAGAIWRIGNGTKVQFWTDRWAYSKPLQDILEDMAPDHPNDFRVSQVLEPNGDWNLTLLDALLPNDMVEKIRGIPRPFAANLEDSVYWSETATGKFLVNSAFQLLQGGSRAPSLGEWRWIWRIPCIEKLRTFLWLILHDRLLTNFSRFHRHMAASPDCPRCVGVEETLSHLFRECPTSSETWKRLGVRSGGFFTYPFKAWIRINATTKPSSLNNTTPWYLVFLGAIWSIWIARNKFVFENKPTLPFQLANWALAQGAETAGAIHLGIFTRFREPIPVRWTIPPPGYFKLNTDGSVNLTTKHASAGGIIRNDEGIWVKGFTINIGEASIFMAELWGLREGLKLCLDVGIQNLCVEMDSISLVKLLNQGLSNNDSVSTLMLDCLALLQQFNNYSITHLYREGNRAADFLAKKGHTAIRGTTVIQETPAELQYILSWDKTGHHVLRL